MKESILKTSIIERLVDRAWLEPCLYSSPSRRYNIRFDSDPYLRPGGLIMSLKEEERELIKTLTSDDFNKHRMDYILMRIPNIYKSLAVQVEEQRRFLKGQQLRYK